MSSRVKGFSVFALLISSLSLIAASAAQTKRAAGLLERALRGEARVIDLSHRLNASVPTFGGETDAFRYEKLADINKEGYAAGAFRAPEHFGTHLDAPGHFLASKETVDRIDVRRLIAPAAVIDIRSKVKDNPDYRLTSDDIRAWEKGGRVPSGAAVLLLTGWSDRWADAKRYRNADASGTLHFPGFSEEAIEYLIKNARIVALGIDTLSIDYGPSKDFAGHKLSHSQGIYHIENLASLDRLPARGAVVICAPLAIEGGSGSPVRVIALAP
jgi:kynurenine formamidase